MGRPRLSTAAALALALVGAEAGADAPVLPGLSAAIPPTWQPAPSAVEPMRRALGSADARVQAWADPARRCAAAALAERVPGKLSSIVEGLRVALAPSSPSTPPVAGAEPPTITARWPAAGTRAGVTIAKLRLDGKDVLVHALACTYGDRYPELCRDRCERLVAALEAP